MHFIGAITRAKDGTITGFKLRSTQDSKELVVKYQSGAALIERKEIITAEELRASLGISENALSKAILDGVVFSVDFKGVNYFPAFFADPELDWKRLARVAKPLHGLSGWHKWFFFTSPKGSLGDLTPLEALKRGMKEDVRTAAYGFAER